MPPTLTEILQTLTLYSSTQRLTKDKPETPFPIFAAIHIERMDAAIRLIAGLKESPGAQIILASLGFMTTVAEETSTEGKV